MKKTLIALSMAALIVGCATHHETATGGLDSSSQTTTGAGSRTVPAADSSFARQACQAGTAEVEIGKLAARNTKNKAVRALAKKLADDHAKAEKELAQLFVRKGMPPEKELAPQFQSSLDHLAALKGREFDRAFKEQVIEDHESAIELFEQQANQGTDADLKAFAQKHLPHLREHLALAQRLDVGIETGAEPDPASVNSVLGNPASRGINIPR